MPGRPLPYVFLSETVLALDCYRLSGDLRWLDLIAVHVQYYLDHEDRALGLHDPFRSKPSVGWSCNYLKGWRRDPITQEQSRDNVETNDVTTSSVIALGIALYAIEAGQAGHIDADQLARVGETLESVATFFLSDRIATNADHPSAGLHQPWQTTPEPFNHVAVYAIALVLADHVQQTDRFSNVGIELGHHIRSFFTRDEDECLFWPYRDNPEARRIVAERFWKSTWVVLLISLMHRKGICFDDRDVGDLSRAMTRNLIRERVPYESLGRCDGRPLNSDIVQFHRERNQDRSLYRFLNFALAEPIVPGIGAAVWDAARCNPHLSAGVAGFDQEAHTALLDSFATWYAPGRTTLCFPWVAGDRVTSNSVSG